MPLPLTVSCFSKIQIGFTFLVPAHPGNPGQGAVKRVCVCVCVCATLDRIRGARAVILTVDDGVGDVGKLASEAIVARRAHLRRRTTSRRLVLSIKHRGTQHAPPTVSE